MPPFESLVGIVCPNSRNDYSNRTNYNANYILRLKPIAALTTRILVARRATSIDRRISTDRRSV